MDKFGAPIRPTKPALGFAKLFGLWARICHEMVGLRNRFNLVYLEKLLTIQMH
jgi:hypothetical protein